MTCVANHVTMIYMMSKAVFNVIIIISAIITNIVPHILRKFSEGSPALSLSLESTHPGR